MERNYLLRGLLLLSVMMLGSRIEAAQPTHFHPLPKPAFTSPDYTSVTYNKNLIASLIEDEDAHAAEAINTLGAVLEKNMHSDLYLSMSPLLKEVTESFQSLCRIENKKIVLNKRLWQFSLAHPYYYSCDLLVPIMLLGCYVAFVKGASEEQESICNSYYEIANVLKEHGPYFVEQAHIFAKDARLALISEGAQSSKEKLEEMNKNIDELNTVFTAKDPAISFDAWIVYGRSFYWLAEASRGHSKLLAGNLSLALESFWRAHEIYEKAKKERKNKKDPIFNNFVFHDLNYVLAAIDATARSARNLAEVYEHVDARRGDSAAYQSYLLSEGERFETLRMELAQIATDLPQEALSETNSLTIAEEIPTVSRQARSKEQQKYDELTVLIMRIEKRIHEAIAYFKKFVIYNQ